MKRRLPCLIFAVLLLLCACKTEETKKIDKPFHLYYLNEVMSAESGVLKEITISLDVSQMSLEEIICHYIETMPPEGTKSALPESWSLHNAKIEDQAAILTFRGKPVSSSENYLAAACMTKILTQLSEIDTVSVLAPGQNEAIRLSDKDILLEDTAMLPQKESIALYLADQSRSYLVKNMQTVEAMEANEKPNYIIRSLLALPTENSCIPQGTKLLDITVDNGLCKVNLSSEFVQNMEKRFACERLAVYSIVNSLTELPEITTVDIWIEGSPLDQLTFMTLPAGMERNEMLISSNSENAADVNLYLSCDEQTLVAVPYRILLQSETNFNESLINALIASEGEYGAKCYIPIGTKLLNLRMEATACIIDLSGEFLANCKSEQEEQLAVYSIVATMCGVDGISSVEILVEGLEPAYRNILLKNIRQPDPLWYAEE